MLSPSPPEQAAAITTPQIDSTAERDGSATGGVGGGESTDSALATTSAADPTPTAVTAVAGEKLSGIAKAMRELEEAACPKKRTMTRFSFLGGALSFDCDSAGGVVCWIPAVLWGVCVNIRPTDGCDTSINQPCPIIHIQASRSNPPQGASSPPRTRSSRRRRKSSSRRWWCGGCWTSARATPSGSAA